MSDTLAFSYPDHYLKPWKMKGDKRWVKIRPIRPEDEPFMVKFHETLSERTVYLRYFYTMKLSKRTEHERLLRICSIDFKNEMVIVAEHLVQNKSKDDRFESDNQIAAVGRVNRISERNEAEIAVLVSDQYQKQGLGSELLNRLLHIGHNAHVPIIVANILPENKVMKKINEKLDFPVEHKFEDGLMKAVFHMENCTQKK